MKLHRCGMATLFCVFQSALAAAPVPSISTDPPVRGEAIAAINREICFSSFWYGTPYLLDHYVDVSLTGELGMVEARGDKFLAPSGKFVTEFTLKKVAGKTYVDLSESYNSHYIKRAPQKGFPLGTIRFKTPSNCTPRNVKSQDRIRLVRDVFDKEISAMNLRGSRVLMGPVNPLLPFTFLYVERSNEVYTVRIPPGIKSAEVRNGTYLFGQITGRYEISALKKKLTKYAASSFVIP